MTPESERWAPGEGEASHPQLKELQHLYSVLTPEGRDELLQCLLIAAARGGGAMLKVLEGMLLCHATEELLGEPLEADGDE